MTVFLSHAVLDADFAMWIADSLDKVGINARLDQLEIKAGDNIVTWMNDAIGESDYLLLLLSPKSIDRYWVKMEWANALMKEAHLRRTFVIPALLTELQDSQIPDLLRARAYLDFRKDPDKAFLQLVSRLKEDKLTERELGRCPSPAPRNMVNYINKQFQDLEGTIEVLIHSNRFGRCFRLRVPNIATPSYLMAMLRDTLKLKYSNIDYNLGVELSYTYYLCHDGKAITLNTSLQDAGVCNGDRLELLIQVTLRDLLKNKDLLKAKDLLKTKDNEQKIFLFSKMFPDDVLKARKRAFSSSEIAQIASQFFAHVDD